MDNKNVILLLLVLLIAWPVQAQQRQVVILKKERVLARYQVGDVLAFARKSDKKIQLQKILALNDTLIMMNLDSVAYYRITKLDIRSRRGRSFTEKLGAGMILAGVLLPVIDLVNTTWVQDQDASIDKGVVVTSGVLLAGGAVLFFAKKPYFKPGRKRRILIVEKGSPFYYQKLLLNPMGYPKN